MTKRPPKTNAKPSNTYHFTSDELGQFDLIPFAEPVSSVLAAINKVNEECESREAKVRIMELAYESLVNNHFIFFLNDDLFYALCIYEHELVCIRAQLVSDSDFMNIFVMAMHKYTGFSINADHFVDLLQERRMQCKLNKRVASVYKRRAGSAFSEYVYYDLGEGHVAVISETGVDMIPNTQAPVFFRSIESGYNQPFPDLENADHNLLYKHLNLKGEAQQLLLLAILAYCIAGEEGYPVLFFTGDAGSGKTEACRLCVSLIDNGSDTIRRLTRKEEDFKLGCFNRHIVAYDNITALTPAQHELICICVTNGTVVSRMLYENTKEQKIRLNNPVFLTAINIPELPADVVDRSLYLRFERFSNAQRKTKTQVYEEFGEDASAILGGILILISKTMHELKTFSPTTTTRLADFSTFGQALALAIGKTPEDFLNACYSCENEMSIDVVESEVVLIQMMDFVSKLDTDEWVGTAAMLSEKLKPRNTPANWPKDPSAFGRLLRKYKTTLLNFGVETESSYAERKRALIVRRLPHFVKNSKNAPVQNKQHRPPRKQ